MKVRRKFNLGRIGMKYESVEFEVEGENVNALIVEIDQCWLVYSQMIKNGEVN